MAEIAPSALGSLMGNTAFTSGKRLSRSRMTGRAPSVVPLPSWVSKSAMPGNLAISSLNPSTRSIHALLTDWCRITTLASGRTSFSARAARRPASTLSDATWHNTKSASLTGASTTTTGMFFCFACTNVPVMPSQFTGFRKMPAAPCSTRSEQSFFCFRLLNWASSVTKRSPWASTTSSRPAFNSTKNGLFMV